MQAQTFELEKSEPKVVLKFREIVPDTLTGSLLYDGKLIEGKVVRRRYKCTFDYNEKHEREIFYAQPTEFYDSENKALEYKNVLGWNLPGNSFAYIGNRWNGFSMTTTGSTAYCNTGLIATDSMPVISEVIQDEFLPNGKTFEISRNPKP